MSGGEDELVAGDGEDNSHATGKKPDLPAAPIFDLSSEQAISANMSVLELSHPSRKEKRKHLKKLRRKQIRQQAAEVEKLEGNAGLDDTALQLRVQLEEQIEAEALALEKAQHDEQERLWLEREKKAMEDFQRQREELEKLEEDRNHQDAEEELGPLEDDGPPEIIWKGNEIIVRKRRVKVLAGSPQALKDATQSTSNPLPPQSAAFAAHNKYLQTPEVHEKTGPMFGTEQDKTHCPFHIKTGVCRFGVRCSRVHVYPDQSFTLLIRNMYTGPGLAWENDEGLEHSDEEVAQHYGEFYEDVLSEFLRFGELVNFKVCKNESSHLRGNVYVHYQTEAGAQAAYSAMNGRFYAGKQITCEFVGVTRWRVALCGEYMKGHHRPCSHGTACNFLHCFRNPHGEYDWADWDSPCPRYWAEKMGKLFGYDVGPEQECDNEFSNDVRRHSRTSRSPRQREYGQVEHRNRDRRPHWDDSEDSGSHRGRRRYETRGDHYGSDSDDQRNSSRHKSHRSRNAYRSSTSKVVEERGGGNNRDAILDSHSRKEEAIAEASHDVKNDGRKRHKRHKPANRDGQVDEFSHESRRVNKRDSSVSCHDSLQDTGTKHDNKWHISRDLDDSDHRQSLDLRISRGRSLEIDSHTIQTGSIEENYYSKKGSNKRTRYKEWVKSYSDSSDNNDVDRSRRRRSSYDHRRRRGGQRRRGRKSSDKQFLTESEESSLDKDDRWTGDRDS